MRKFNTIKKSRKKSKDIDEKIQYLNKECQKTGLNEIANSTDGVYQGTTSNPNSGYAEITGKNFNGRGFAMSGDSNLGQGNFGGASIRASDGAALSPPHPDTGEIKTTSTKGGISPMFKLAIPGERPTPDSRMTGPIMWYWDPSGSGSWKSLEYNSAAIHGNQPYPFGGDNAGWGYWGSNFMGFPLLRSDGAAFASLFNTINDFDPKDSTPFTTVFTKDRLDDPNFLPIDIKGISSQAFDWLRDKAQDALDLLSNPFEPVLDLLADLTGTSAEKDNVDDYIRNFIPDLLAGNEPIGSTPDNPRDNSEVYDDKTISDYEEIFQDYQSEINGEKDSLDISWEDKYNLTQRDNSSIGNTTGTLDPEAGDGFIDNGDGTVTFRKAFDFDRYDDMAGSNLATTLGAMGYGIMSGIPGLLYSSGGKTPTMYTGITFNKKTGKVIKNYKPNVKESLDESVKLGHFEPEVLTVDIEKLRKGIAPEFPKDPPPEMIGGYSAKSRLVRKEPELPPFIKVTKKDLARNHRLTDKEISDFMNDVNMINDYIKKNPAELKYAMIRYPKNDPRLAQLNFKMDQMKAASDEYMNTHFPENQKLFSKLQDKIIRNISQTDPKNFTGHKEAPKFTDDNIEMSEQRKQIALKHFKKPVKIKKLFRKG